MSALQHIALDTDRSHKVLNKGHSLPRRHPCLDARPKQARLEKQKFKCVCLRALSASNRLKSKSCFIKDQSRGLKPICSEPTQRLCSICLDRTRLDRWMWHRKTDTSPAERTSGFSAPWTDRASRREREHNITDPTRLQPKLSNLYTQAYQKLIMMLQSDCSTSLFSSSSGLLSHPICLFLPSSSIFFFSFLVELSFYIRSPNGLVFVCVERHNDTIQTR